MCEVLWKCETVHIEDLNKNCETGHVQYSSHILRMDTLLPDAWKKVEMGKEVEAFGCL